MRPRSLLFASVVLLLFTAPAAAQGAGPMVDVSISGLPADPIVLKSNQSEEVTVSVTLHAENFACTQQGTFPVALDLQGEPGAVDRFAVSPGRLNFTVPPGVYGGAAEPYNKSKDATITLAVNGTVPSNHTHQLTLVAKFLPDDVTGCQATGDFPEASAQGNLTVTMVAPPPQDTNNTKGNGDGGGGIPGPGALTVSLALVAAATVARRRLS